MGHHRHAEARLGKAELYEAHCSAMSRGGRSRKAEAEDEQATRPNVQTSWQISGHPCRCRTPGQPALKAVTTDLCYNLIGYSSQAQEVLTQAMFL